MSSHRWKIVLVLFVMAVALYVDRINISIAAPVIAREFSLSPADLGSVLSVFLFGYAIGLIPGGYLADRIGPRRLLTAAALLWGITTAAVACLPRASPAGLAALITARFLLGLCEACAFPTFNRVIANWMLSSERARASGWLHCGAGLGGALTPLLIAFVMAYWGWRTAFLLSGAFTCSVALWWLRAAMDHPADHPRVSAAELALIMNDRRDNETRPQPPDLVWFQRMLRSRAAWLLSASEFSFGVAGFIFATWFYTYMVQVRGAASMRGALLSSMPYLAIALGAPLGGFLCDRSVRVLGAPWGRRLVPLLTIPLSGVALVFAPAIASNTAAAALFALAAGLQYIAAPAFWSTVIDVTRRGAGVLGGVMNGSNYFGAALATALFPLLVARTGWSPAVESVSAAAFVSGLLWLGINSSCQIDQSAEDPP